MRTSADDPDDDDVLVYRWDFSDGETAEGIVVHHRWGRPRRPDGHPDRRGPGAGLTAQDTRTIVITPPETTLDASIDIPFGRKLVSDAPFTMTAGGGVEPDRNGRVSLEWDFGEDRVWRVRDIANPGEQPFRVDAVGAR